MGKAVEKVLVTGFGPFGKRVEVNPSTVVAERVTEQINGNVIRVGNDTRTIIAANHIADVAFSEARNLVKLVEQSKPDMVVGIGYDSRLTDGVVRLEGRFRNSWLHSARDERGERMRPWAPIVPSADKALYPATPAGYLDRETTVPTELSSDAGGFVYEAMGYGISHAAPIYGSLFMHIGNNGVDIKTGAGTEQVGSIVASVQELIETGTKLAAELRAEDAYYLNN